MEMPTQAAWVSDAPIRKQSKDAKVQLCQKQFKRQEDYPNIFLFSS